MPPESDHVRPIGSVAARLPQLYALTWVFEGALRKWVAPALQQPLYFLRVLVVVAAMAVVLPRLKRPWPPIALAALGFVLFVTVFGVVHVESGAQTPLQAILGARLWLEFVVGSLTMAALMSFDTAMRLARTLVWLVYPTAPVALLQVLNPPSAWINKLLADDGSDNFVNASVAVRATGFFSSAVGHSTFVLIASAACILVASSGRSRERWPALGAIPLLAMLVATSGSRGSLFGVGLLVSLYALAAIWGVLSFSARQQVGAALPTIAGLIGVIAVVWWLAPLIAPDAMVGLSSRLSGAGLIQEPQSRGQSLLLGWMNLIPVAPEWGLGLGATAQGLGAAGQGSLTESEVSQWVMQLGPALFVVLGTLRLIVVIWLMRPIARAVAHGAAGQAGVLGAALWTLPFGATTSQGSANGGAVLVLLLIAGLGMPSPSQQKPLPPAAQRQPRDRACPQTPGLVPRR